MMKDKAVLKQEVSSVPTSFFPSNCSLFQTDLDDCADLFVSIAKNKSMTGQEVVVGKLNRCRMCSTLIVQMVACAQACVSHAKMWYELERSFLFTRACGETSLFFDPNLPVECDRLRKVELS